ncbi:winged helix-turn-helix transcriptional regulator [archaeon]|nr:winged helix-turn-helix transcriptional regulator [archaeon]MBT4416727.1 winged helix-turn-helix transcriptional regulator [archaeon]
MDKKFILVSMDDEKSKELGAVISNDTSRKILDLLGEKSDISAQQIAKKLKLNLSTVTYNLKHLREQGLIKHSDFAWSDKGRRIELYSLANKIVIIAPKGFDFKDTLKKIIPIGLIGGAISLALKLSSSFKTMGGEIMAEDARGDVMELAMEESVQVVQSSQSFIPADWWIYTLILTFIIVLLIVLIDFRRAKK